MNKAALVDSMSKMTKLPKSTCRDCLEAFISSVAQSLKKGNDVVLTGFGTWSVLKRKSRVGVNPATKKKMTIPAKKVPRFRAGKALKSVVK